jgi:hypothetical protein
MPYSNPDLEPNLDQITAKDRVRIKNSGSTILVVTADLIKFSQIFKKN